MFTLFSSVMLLFNLYGLYNYLTLRRNNKKTIEENKQLKNGACDLLTNCQKSYQRMVEEKNAEIEKLEAMNQGISSGAVDLTDSLRHSHLKIVAKKDKQIEELTNEVENKSELIARNTLMYSMEFHISKISFNWVKKIGKMKLYLQNLMIYLSISLI